ncbi:MAG TPA: DNA topoisomerase VI subunit B [Candidatus Woesearchaeota archaeon]|nr:DNA topoisomerase VI subunit B [Candidatus Woesearchaeota archaeon]
MDNNSTLLSFGKEKLDNTKESNKQDTKDLIESDKTLVSDLDSKKPKPKTQAHKRTAEELAKAQREISIAEFFEKNRHLLGFDNPRKALLTAVKEAVDNSLDACEEAGILPELYIEIIAMSDDRYRIIIEDNGPGIVKEQVPKIFAKLLYGSKFHAMKQSRGQQGIGISAAGLYAQLTTGKPIRIISKTSQNKPAYYCELLIDTQRNIPVIQKEENPEWEKENGTKIELDLEANYYKGSQSVDEYLKQVAIVNPHATIVYTNPKAEQTIYARAVEEMPKEAKSIKPHPYGVELGALIKMLKLTTQKTSHSFLTSEFSRVSTTVATEILELAGISPTHKPKDIDRNQAEHIINAIKKVKIMNPPVDCLSPIGEEQLEKGIKKEVNAEFYKTISRPPAVYRGNPFVIEASIAYGGNISGDQPATILRFANRVPLLYQAGACAFTKSVIATSWKSYGLNQSRGSLPIGPLLIVLHMASVWTPYTSEAKEAIASYPEIIKEIKLALQQVGRELQKYVSKKGRVKDEFKKRSYISKFIPHIAQSVAEMLSQSEDVKKELESKLITILEQKRGKLEKLEFDASANEEFDESMALGISGGLLEDDILQDANSTESTKKTKKNKKTSKKDENDESSEDYDYKEEDYDNLGADME